MTVDIYHCYRCGGDTLHSEYDPEEIEPGEWEQVLECGDCGEQQTIFLYDEQKDEEWN